MNFKHNDIFNGGQDNISVIIDRKRYQVYHSEAKNCFWIYYNHQLVEITIPEDLHSLVEKSLTK
jgi:hypothetical protein